ncbi:MAG TPA: hypothetical protein VGR47_20250 [Terracidiphilus sp.]|nr:hypothetical protein [Terracidiphilus sp.]
MIEQIEFEGIDPQRQKEGWQAFAQYLNRGYAVEAGIPVATNSQPTKRTDEGWTTKVTFPTTADDVADAEPDDESDDEEFPDNAKQRRWLKAIFALLGGATHSKAAIEAGVSNRQLSRWKADGEFIELYQATKSQVFRESVNGMKGILTAAGIVGAKALQQIAEDSEASDTARVQAARALTQLALEINDLETLAQDIAALKAAKA